MLLQPLVLHLSQLLRLIVGQYFAQLPSILIVYNNSASATPLQLEYLSALELVLRELSQPIRLQWINVAFLRDLTDLEDQVMGALNSSVTEGFITILSQTHHFIHARYYATRNANVRLKDKRYLFLCEDESPAELLHMDILQFYPHHLMVRPGTETEAGAAPTGPKTGPQPDPGRREGASVNTRNKDEGEGGAGTKTTSPYRDINFELWTQKFVGAFGNLDALLLDAFLPNETFANRVELYPNKLLNLQRRSLLVGSITYVPYTITNYVPAGQGDVDPIHPQKANRSLTFDGAEANVLKTFCQVHNCHLRVEAYGADNWGGIYDNESSDGMLGDIYEQRVEVAIGCIYNWYDGITETSDTIARSSVTILGPAPAPLPSWRTNIMPFNNRTWLLLIATLVTCGTFLYFMKYVSYCLRLSGTQARFHHSRKLEKSMLDIFALFIQQPSAPLGFDRFAPRFFLATLLCATITLENIYSGQLKSMLTFPFYSAPVDTIEKWAHSDWKWSAPSIIWVHTVESSDLQTEQILARNFEVHDYSYLSNVSFMPNYGLGIERLSSGSLSVGDYVSTEALENRIFIDKYMDKKKQEVLMDLATGHQVKGAPQALDVHNIAGALFVLAFGVAFAACALLVELLIHRMDISK
uniref:GG23878 n=1 Tax=Drosophila erecta TaxID=7220 RepID=B3NYZ5_DROER